MNVRKFFGANTREALRQVRDALGADALILSNRRVDGGVEIMAVSDGEVQALTYDPRASGFESAPAPQQPAIQPETIAAILHRRQGVGNANPGPAQSVRPPQFETLKSPNFASSGAAAYRETAQVASEPLPRAVSPARQEAAVPWELPVDPGHYQAPAAPALPPLGAAAEHRPDPLVAEMAQELKRMRGLLESQLSGFAWGELARKDPLKAELMRNLLGAGFSPLLSRQLIDALPHGLDLERGTRWLQAALAHNLRVVEPGADFIMRGGVYALVGPTGVGKTTTVAKLAARAVLKFGADKVALITTDSYRIGAHEQLRIYGRILNVPVHVVKDEAELELTLADLTRSHLILIDTVGMSQRDRRIAEQIEFLCGRGSRIKRHLILPATAQSVTLDDIVRAYRGSGMDGVLLSKIDESLSIAPAIDCVIRHGLDLHYVTNGQKVPEDLHLANARYLIDRALGKTPAPEVSGLQAQTQYLMAD
ncbi:MAG: flagellar biosynthesis protein FlhF [Methylobacterium sp.]|nr:flagellar biosynthesis protein FlhF [Methylobacterium sp.]